MSNYGPTPGGQPNPYGQPQQPSTPPPPPTHNAYGQPPANPYGQPAAPQYGVPAGYGEPAGPANYAAWIKRVAAFLIDQLIYVVAGGVLIGIGGGIGGSTDNTAVHIIGTVIAVIGYIAAAALFIWNLWIKQGSTGYTIGKGVLGIKLVREDTRQPIGIGLAIGRYFVHYVDTIACYLGWLWPLWDAKRQTLADKILSTIVINEPKPK